MAYNEQLADRIRIMLKDIRKVEEKKMMGGLCFMVKGKMCVGVDKEDLMVRCDPYEKEALLSKKGSRVFDLTGKPMKGWLLVSPEGTASKNDLSYWVTLSLDFINATKTTPKKKK